VGREDMEALAKDFGCSTEDLSRLIVRQLGQAITEAALYGKAVLDLSTLPFHDRKDDVGS
jgi:hypothetical protein